MNTHFRRAARWAFVASSLSLAGCAATEPRSLLILSPDIGSIPGVDIAAHVVYPNTKVINDGIRSRPGLVAQVSDIYTQKNETLDWVQFGSHAVPNSLTMEADYASRLKTLRVYVRFVKKQGNSIGS